MLVTRCFEILDWKSKGSFRSYSSNKNSKKTILCIDQDGGEDRCFGADRPGKMFVLSMEERSKMIFIFNSS